MHRHILTTALLTASLALAAPALAAPKIAKPVDAQTHPQKQPENSNPLQIAQHIQTKDLIGVWSHTTQTDAGELLTITLLATHGKGTSWVIMPTNEHQSSVTSKQQFTWQFNEETQEITQRITAFFIAHDTNSLKPDKFPIGKTSTTKVSILRLNGKPDMLELTNQTTGEKQRYFKRGINKLIEILQD